MDRIPVSVVIICCNAAATIKRAIVSAHLITDDVVVVDSGSTDNTPSHAAEAGARVLQLEWMGYGETKNAGNRAARNFWIFSLDADEEISVELAAAVKKINITTESVVYSIKLLNYLGGQAIYHGEWQNNWAKRLFNKTKVRWDAAPIHENLILPPDVQLKKLHGLLHHYTAESIESYSKKLDNYAQLMAVRYQAKKKKAAGLKMFVSPVFSFVKYYLVQGGWMDKKAGFEIAIAHARYTYKKYKGLKSLNKGV
jgi:glycosyltransferase involved in cell wall biosynthesis